MKVKTILQVDRIDIFYGSKQTATMIGFTAATNGVKDFISVLMLYKEFDEKDLQTAVELSLTADAGSSATVEHVLRHSSKPRQQFDCAGNWQRLPPADCDGISADRR